MASILLYLFREFQKIYDFFLLPTLFHPHFFYPPNLFLLLNKRIYHR